VARRLPKAQRRRQRKRLKVVEAQSFNAGVFVFREKHEKVDAERLNGVLVFYFDSVQGLYKLLLKRCKLHGTELNW